MHLDIFKLIVQENSDAGDSLANHATWAVAKVLRTRVPFDRGLIEILQDGNWPLEWCSTPGYTGAIDCFSILPGKYLRSLSPGWWQNENTTSRDQKIPAMMINGLLGQRSALLRMHTYLLKRFLFDQNIYRTGVDGPSQGRKIPDTWIGHLQWFIRPYGGVIPWIMWPLLLINDFFGLFASLFSIIPFTMKDGGSIARKTPNDVDTRNAIMAHLCALTWAPTPLSWLSRNLFAKYVNINYGMLDVESVNYPESYLYRETNRVMGSLVWYFRKEAGGNPEIAEALRPIIEKYF